MEMSKNKQIVLSFLLAYIITISSGIAIISYFLNEEEGEIRGEKMSKEMFLEPRVEYFVEDEESGMTIEGGTLIVFVKAGVPKDEVRLTLEVVDGEIVSGCNEKRIYQVYLPETDLISTKNALGVLKEENIFEKVDVNYQIVF